MDFAASKQPCMVRCAKLGRDDGQGICHLFGRCWRAAQRYEATSENTARSDGIVQRFATLHQEAKVSSIFGWRIDAKIAAALKGIVSRSSPSAVRAWQTSRDLWAAHGCPVDRCRCDHLRLAQPNRQRLTRRNDQLNFA
jgi:hypothetical protein